MAGYHRLSILPLILQEFYHLKQVYINVVEVDVFSIRYLQDTQIMKITDILKRYLGCTVHIINKVDKNILGGILIRIGDMVIDGSIRGRILRLNNLLQF